MTDTPLPTLHPSPNSGSNQCRLLGAASFTLLLLSACASSSSLPKVAMAKKRLPAGEQAAVVRDDRLAERLLHVQASRSGAGSEVTEAFLASLQKRVNVRDWKRPLRIQGTSGTWEMQFDDRAIDAQGRPEWSPSLFDRVIPASAFDLSDYLHVVSGKGAGAPVVLACEDGTELRKLRNFRAGNGVYAAGTVVLEFGRPGRGSAVVPVRMRIYNTFDHRNAEVAGSVVPLAYNVTSAIEAELGNDYVMSNGLSGLLHPNRRVDSDLGLFGVNVYDPSKIPVVFVHGLNSSPAIWRSAVNEIYADPELHARYQPLLFIYPTGMSVPGAGARFRQSLERYREFYDPDHNDAGFNQMVIVGHSMGGLLTRLQVIDSGDELSRAFFARPIDENYWLSDDQKRTVKAALIFKPEPFVKRAVFVAVPHRGSKMADIGIVRLAIRLIKLPMMGADLAARAAAGDASYLNPALRRFNSLGLRSVDMLSPEHPYFAALDKCPIRVPFHSIIGNRGKADAKESSDGVVPYWSSHMDKAESEKIIPYGHSCTMKREAVVEIMRILKLHGER